MSRDRLFLRFTVALFAVMAIFGTTMGVVLIWGNEAVGLRMINVFAAMFSAVVGLGTGYLLGREGGGEGGGSDQDK